MMGASVPDRATHAPHEAAKASSPSGEYPSRKLRVLSLFAGIGGFDLGLERTGGFETVAFCEIDPFCQRVLAKHWPGVPCYDDVRTLTAARLAADGITVDCIAGGFPCQDISAAGLGAGIEAERSGLWSEMGRLVRELRPAYLIVENVSALLGRGLDRVLGDLAKIGYDAWWDCIPAAAVGAPHRRDRIWIVAYPDGIDRGAGGREGWRRKLDRLEARVRSRALANTETVGRGARWPRRPDPSSTRQPEQALQDVAHATGERRGEARGGQGGSRFAGSGGAIEKQWDAEPNVGRVAHGVPARVDRLKALGNAVVPQIPELIGNAILASLAEQRRAA